MILPKFTLLQILRITLVAGLISVVLAGAWRNQTWAFGLTLAGFLALLVALFAALSYWFYFLLGKWLSAKLKRGTTPLASASIPKRDGN